MNVEIVPCLFDNYAYLLVDQRHRRALVVDPSEGVPVLRRLEELGLAAGAVLCTHHHGDHVGGLPELLERFPGIRVYAHAHDRERIPGVTDLVRGNDEVTIGSFAVRVLHVPGHTLGALTWLAGDVAFTGDTLFAGGCGRVFEGTPQMMYRSLNEALATLAPDTKIYCGHEYTIANLTFAQQVEPGNEAIARALEDAKTRRTNKQATLPSTIARERETNPFLRCDQPAVGEFARNYDAGGVDPVSVFAAVRAAKNQFKG